MRFLVSEPLCAVVWGRLCAEMGVDAATGRQQAVAIWLWCNSSSAVAAVRQRQCGDSGVSVANDDSSKHKTVIVCDRQ